MSASRKRSSLELSREQPSKKGKQSVALTKSDFPNELIDRITDTVKERVHAVIAEVLDRHVAEAVKSIRDAFEGRLQAIEKTVQDLTESLEFQTQHHATEVEALQDRVDELETALGRQVLENNFVISGLPETTTETTTDETKKTVLDFCSNTLHVQINPDDIIDTFRLGKPTGGRSIDKPSISRRILVKTRARHVKEAVMNQRIVRLKGKGIYVNDDLTPKEQSQRRSLVPIYRELRAKGIQCHLDRGSLVVGKTRYRDASKARREIPTTVANPAVRRSLEDSFNQAAMSSTTANN